jgi:hypothetical protein
MSVLAKNDNSAVGPAKLLSNGASRRWGSAAFWGKCFYARRGIAPDVKAVGSARVAASNVIAAYSAARLKAKEMAFAA